MSNRKRILICDDEEGVRESLKLILEDDYDLVVATSGNDAIEKAKETPIDLAILDIKMPKMSGIEVLKALKKILPSMKAIIASGYQSAEAAHESIKYGAGDYIVKPFDSKEVLKKVKAIIQP